MDKSTEGSKSKEGASQVAQTVKASAYNTGDPGSILGSHMHLLFKLISKIELLFLFCSQDTEITCLW